VGGVDAAQAEALDGPGVEAEVGADPEGVAVDDAVDEGAEGPEAAAGDGG